MGETEQVYAFRAVKDCGCLAGLAVDRPEYRKDNKKALGEWALTGARIERVTVEEARQSVVYCDEHARPTTGETGDET